MPPRGLKASAKKGAFVPPSAPPPAAVAAPTTTDSTSESSGGVVRTAPLDEDGLTVEDLFEIRQSALDLLCSAETTPDQVEEARGLLRGILHGCDALVALVYKDRKEAQAAKGKEEDDEWNWFDFDDDRCEGVGGSELQSALGLTRWFAPAQVLYLQAFALHELGLIATPVQSGAVATAEGRKKKRKVDVNEPTKPEEWLDQAIEKYRVAQEWWSETGGRSGEGWAELSYHRGLLYVELARCLADRAGIALSADDEATGKDLVDEACEKTDWLDGDVSEWLERRLEGDASEEGYEDVFGDLVGAALRAISSIVAVAEAFPTAVDSDSLGDILNRIGKRRYLPVKPVDQASQFYDEDSRGYDEDDENADDADDADDEFVNSPNYQKRVLELELLKADIRLLIFVSTEEAIEQKYRPEEEGADEDEEEGDVVPLPDAKDVKEAKEKGLEVIESLNKTIELLAASSDKAEAATKAQYQK
ncbi:hypothetical protein MNV49_002190, partial [Pseudohyphozyma bogoriensis]